MKLDTDGHRYRSIRITPDMVLSALSEMISTLRLDGQQKDHSGRTKSPSIIFQRQLTEGKPYTFDTINQWIKRQPEGIQKDTAITMMEKLKELMEARLVRLGLLGKLNENILQLILRKHYGYGIKYTVWPDNTNKFSF
jgi:hypothetical protein